MSTSTGVAKNPPLNNQITSSDLLMDQIIAISGEANHQYPLSNKASHPLPASFNAANAMKDDNLL
eukprot:CAMPEP_0175071830 /NCGR_PEP_ID=MMETSP0052_2-20121109/19488_1 /TAXON_ID=51329 ORGANISM="Polytomella parva, Strain SAG 63-3" /NCGR_SAMPLE_ID=MMETSP0052_2 /ASSEMBLY_ACC=CAM_ASM_000194 /LENGTH=64 /DNA_ID=CAMNT_0016339099 /DNA_START=51 /DNA_END=241 /DNA_ORIENTATION=-